MVAYALGSIGLNETAVEKSLPPDVDVESELLLPSERARLRSSREARVAQDHQYPEPASKFEAKVAEARFIGRFQQGSDGALQVSDTGKDVSQRSEGLRENDAFIGAHAASLLRYFCVRDGGEPRANHPARSASRAGRGKRDRFRLAGHVRP